MSQIDGVLMFLLDGTWHDLIEVSNILQINYEKLEKIVKLLTEFNFIEISEHNVRVTVDTKKFLKSIKQDLERKGNIS